MSPNDKDDLFQRWDDSAQDDLYGLDGAPSDLDADGIGWTLDDSHLPPPPEALAAIKAKMEGGEEEPDDDDLGDFFDDLEQHDAFGELEHNDAFGDSVPAYTPPADDAIDVPTLASSNAASNVFDHNQAGLDPSVPSFGDLERSGAFIDPSPRLPPVESHSPFEAPVLDSFAGVPVTKHDLEPELDLDTSALTNTRPAASADQTDHGSKPALHPLDDFAARNPKTELEGDFFSDLSSAPSFVLKNDGAILIGFATIVLLIAVMGAMGRSLLGGLVSLGCYGFFYSYLMRITAVSGEGAEKLPDFNDYSSMWHDGFIPTFQISVLTFLYALPVFGVSTATTHPVALGLVGFACLLFFPVGFINLSMRGSILDIRPGWQIKAITAQPKAYFSAAAAFAVGIGLLIVITVALAGSLDPSNISWSSVAIRFVFVVALFVYGSVLFAHVMGRFFYRNAHAIEDAR